MYSVLRKNAASSTPDLRRNLSTRTHRPECLMNPFFLLDAWFQASSKRYSVLRTCCVRTNKTLHVLLNDAPHQ